MKAPPRVVLDTKVLVSALVFGGGMPARVRAAWMGGKILALASAATTQEFARVLAYPKVNLSPAEQQDLLADYLPWVEAVNVPHPPPAVPACRDALDLPFLHLAVAGRADALVSGDKDLLAVGRVRRGCPVLGVESFCRAFSL